MKHGEVRWYTFPHPDKRRPVLILTRNSALEFLNEVTIAPITSIIREIPTEVALNVSDGMSKDCAVNLDHLQTVSRKRIGARITAISAEKMASVKQALLFALGLNLD